MQTVYQTNFNNFLKLKNIRTNVLKIGTLTIENGTISGLKDPVENDDYVNKNYADNFLGTSAANPLNSIQINSGTTFSGTSNLLYHNTSGELFVNNKIFFQTLTITNNVIDNLSDPVDSQDGCNLNYLLNKKLAYKSVTNSSQSVTLSSIFDTYLFRTNSTSNSQDILPSTHTKNFNFVYNYTGPTKLLYGNFILKGNYNYYNQPLNVVTVSTNTIICMKGVIDSSYIITYYIISSCCINAEPIITSDGLITENFASNYGPTKSALIIYPIVNTIIDDSSTVEYTYDMLKNRLITRTGLTSNTTDTFGTVPNFGMFKISIRNLSNYDLTFGPSVDWTIPTVTLTSNQTGVFYVNKKLSTMELYILNVLG